MPVIQLDLDSTGAISSLRKFDNAVDATAVKTDDAFGKIRKKVNEIGEAVFKAMAAGGTALIALGVTSLDAAARMQEAQNKYDVVFSGMTDTVDTWVQELRDNYALSELAAKDYLSSTKAIIDGTGMQSAAAANLSNQLVLLAQDLASFHDKSPEQAVRAMTSALTGEMEAMKQFGVVLKTEEIKHRAMIDNHLKSTDAVTQAMMAQAAYALILQKSGEAQGDAIRSQDSYTFQLKQTKAMIEDIRVEIGEQFLPIATEMLKMFQEWIIENDAVNKAMLYTVQTIRFVHNGISGLILAGHGLVAGFATVFDFLINGFLDVGKPLDKLGQALVDLGAIENNPFDKLRVAVSNFKESTRDTFNEQLAQIEKNNAAYDRMEEKIQAKSAAHKKVTEAVKETTEAVKKAEVATENYNRSMITVEKSTAGMELVNGVWQQVAGTVVKVDKAVKKVVETTNEQAVPAVKEGLKPAEESLKAVVDEVTNAVRNSTAAFQGQSVAATQIKDTVLEYEALLDNIARPSGGGGGDLGKTSKIAGTVSAHGGALSDEEWQSLPQWQKDFLTSSALKGTTTLDYFSRPGDSRFVQSSGYNQQALAFQATQFTQTQRSEEQNQASITNIFNQSISRSDVVNIVEEMNRSIARA